MTVNSKAHLSIVMVKTNGSIFLWNARPAKIIQPLAPFFTESDENMEYIEREDEFEEELSDEDPDYQKLTDDQKKKVKFARTKLDVETISEDHLCTFAQITANKLRP